MCVGGCANCNIYIIHYTYTYVYCLLLYLNMFKKFQMSVGEFLFQGSINILLCIDKTINYYTSYIGLLTVFISLLYIIVYSREL